MNRAREAGIKRVVNIGSFYPQVAPELIKTSAYVRSRHESDVALRALHSQEFFVCSLNAPFILGHVPGLEVPHLQAWSLYAAGRIPDVPMVAPDGGVNHISTRSLSEAIVGAFENGKGGHGYLVGDENLSWKDYIAYYQRAAGNELDLSVSPDEHPMFPDDMLIAGRNSFIRYEPENGELNYSTNVIGEAILEIVDGYLG